MTLSASCFMGIHALISCPDFSLAAKASNGAQPSNGAMVSFANLPPPFWNDVAHPSMFLASSAADVGRPVQRSRVIMREDNTLAMAGVPAPDYGANFSVPQ